MDRCTIALKAFNKKTRIDNAPLKRVELHCHTIMSEWEGVSTVEEIIEKAAELGMEAIAVTDEKSIQAFPDAFRKLRKMKNPPKVILGIDIDVFFEDSEKMCGITVLAKNECGRTSLNNLITEASRNEGFYISDKWLKDNKDGLLIGFAGLKGWRGYAGYELKEFTEDNKNLFDYFEVYPESTFRESEESEYEEAYAYFEDDEELKTCKKSNALIIEIANKLGKPVVATSNAYFADPEDILYRKIMSNYACLPCDRLIYATGNFYIRTTEEMLKEFEYLGKDIAYQIVVENSRNIAEMIENMYPVSNDRFMVKIPKSEKILKEIADDRLKALYNKKIPDEVSKRYKEEMTAITSNEYSDYFVILKAVADRSKKLGYPFSVRGCLGASYVAYLLELTKENPMDFNIPWETYFGLDGSKKPDVSINISREFRSELLKTIKEELPGYMIVWPNNIVTIEYDFARRMTEEYFDRIGIIIDDNSKENISRKISEVKDHDEASGFGFFLVDRTAENITAIEEPRKGEYTTHFRSWEVHNNFLKMDFIDNRYLSMLYQLEKLTGVKSDDIEYKNKKLIDVLAWRDAVNPIGILGFRNSMARKIAGYINPKDLKDIIRVDALLHDTDAWENNSEDLIKSGTTTFDRIIATRDDVMNSLLDAGVSREMAYEIMERVRMGKGLRIEQELEMESVGIPKWYIDSCKKVRYLFPAAHSLESVIGSLKLAYYKVNYPTEFYKAYYMTLCREGSKEYFSVAEDLLNNKIRELEKTQGDEWELEDNAEASIGDLYVIRDMLNRGIKLNIIRISASLEEN